MLSVPHHYKQPHNEYLSAISLCCIHDYFLRINSYKHNCWTKTCIFLKKIDFVISLDNYALERFVYNRTNHFSWILINSGSE